MAEEIFNFVEETKDEHWCLVCNNYTDYRRKWTTVPRADLDGGVYSDNFEVPHCIHCDSMMLNLNDCKRLVWLIRLSVFIFLTVATSVCFYLYDPSIKTFGVWIGLVGLSALVGKLPRKSKQAVKAAHRYAKQQKLHVAQKILNVEEVNKII